MSSQGPSTGTSTGSGSSGCFGNTQNSQVPAGYTFSTISLRDGSDWIAYKKQKLIQQETTSRLNQTTWFKAGNDFRIQYNLGKFKCNCDSNAFAGSVPDR